MNPDCHGLNTKLNFIPLYFKTFGIRILHTVSVIPRDGERCTERRERSLVAPMGTCWRWHPRSRQVTLGWTPPNTGQSCSRHWDQSSPTPEQTQTH